ncbi:sucrose phosphorylase [Lentilactobacillus kisonensis]|uniref:Sucrose phosphorylase n=2 Tax=Lentilactobacillus kisonensis TaxID=481722 RepID=H1LL37_9LACO|nr:sucrose phosphorylase [Lentilactobacillus kisonensis]EHO45249.1 sucrose phosphorylase [Lentilactobacillus kisonensis F0435]KRL20241.1 sucrose phosphorylase [Lentilactobacillus kisonensis DSM 19906 = JCM 15041]
MKLTNKAMLITYPDSLGNNLKDLQHVLSTNLDGVVGGVHLLPFFPSAGDRGFSPVDYQQVDPKFGNWEDVQTLAKKYYLMFDFMVNHISKHSKYFQDFLKNHNQSAYRDLFIHWDEFWPAGRPTQKDIDLIYKRKPKAPVQEITFADGEKGKVWNTFGEDQIDLDVTKQATKDFIKNTLDFLMKNGASIIRLDAFAYAVKKLDTNDFFVEPEIWDLLDNINKITAPHGTTLLPEIHENYHIVRKLTDHDYFSYDFALPIVTLYSLYSGDTTRLAGWLKSSPMHQFTTLDTHDGIGVVDAKDILSDDELDYTKSEMYKVGANVKKVYSSTAYHNLDVYQINTTYYSALGDNDPAYLLARATQIFAPGIPQVYYVGLLAGKNDLDLLEKTKEGRNINRHYYSLDEINQETKRPVVKDLFSLLRFRNTSSAFDLDGRIQVDQPSSSQLTVTRTSADGKTAARLTADFNSKLFTVEATDGSNAWEKVLDSSNL